MSDTSGDVRVWSTKYESALRHIETGNVVEARKILSQLATDAPDEQIRKNAAALETPAARREKAPTGRTNVPLLTANGLLRTLRPPVGSGNGLCCPF